VESEIERLIRVLLGLDSRAIHRAAREIQRRRADPSDDLAWWEATMAVDQRLSQTRRSVQGATAGRAAAEAVVAAARRAGLDSDDPDVVVIARRARLVARAATAGPRVERHTQYLLRGWWDIAMSASLPHGIGSVA